MLSWFKKKKPPEIFDLFEVKPPDRPLDGFTKETLIEAQRRYAEGHKLAQAGDDAKAILVYNGALELVPVFWEALDNRGFCYMRQGQFDR
ncbi:MAG: hypothetical protein R3236_07285, partial [Phycisphaeraceae bacterium]|nr:hypothetical protein [Phycisphaeraceae bacterium]